MRDPRIATTFALALSACIALADGMFVPKDLPSRDPESHARDITEPSQKGLIVFDGKKEMLYLQVSYKGAASAFAWLVPTPQRPNVENVDAPIFHVLHEATAPRLRFWFDADKRLRNIRGDEMATTTGAKSIGGADVTVLEEEQLGAYDIAVLRAGDAGDLLRWLRTNGYLVTPKLEPVLADYVRRQWVFTAMRIDTTHQAAAARRLRSGVLQSIKFTFPARQAVYPLKVSSLNPGKTDILLYVLADHRMNEPVMHTDCCISLNPYYLEEIGDDTATWLATGQEFTLTKLTASLTPGQMTRDLVLKNAATDDYVPLKTVPPPFLDNLGATSLLLFTVVCPCPLSLLVLLAVGLIAWSQPGRRRWRVWFGAGVVFVGVGLLLYGDRGLAVEPGGFHKAGVDALILAGMIVLGAIVCAMVSKKKPAAAA